MRVGVPRRRPPHAPDVSGYTAPMETSEALPGGGIDLGDLQRVFDAPGPFLSVFLTTEPRVENAAQRSDARWRTLRAEAASVGAPDDVLSEIDPLIADAHERGEALAVIATPTGVVHTEYGPAPLPTDEVRWGPLPHLLPVVAWRQADPPHIIVLTDRTGADLYGIRRGAPEIERQVQGDHDEIRKVAPGGWSQQRYQSRAEDSWRHNADEVVDAVAALADRIEPHVILVAGDVRAVSLVRDRLPERVKARVEVIEGERPWDGSHANLPPELRTAIDATVRSETDRLLERLAEELGQDDKAVTGLAAVARALSRAQVATLLRTESPIDRTLSFGPDPTLLSTSHDDLVGMGVDDPQESAADDVLLHAAIATGAQVRLVPAFDDDAGDRDLDGDVERLDAKLKDGVGALLRWA
jgi:hypothetical protein